MKAHLQEIAMLMRDTRLSRTVSLSINQWSSTSTEWLVFELYSNHGSHCTCWQSQQLWPLSSQGDPTSEDINVCDNPEVWTTTCLYNSTTKP